MAIRFPFALYAPSLKEQVYSYPWHLITEIIYVGRMYTYLLTWSPSYLVHTQMEIVRGSL